MLPTSFLSPYQIAAKYDEIYPPLLENLEDITDMAYLKDEILSMESEIVSTLKWEFTVPTAHTFLCRFLKAAHALSCYLAERTLQEYTMLKFLPSTIAATAVMVARKSLNRHPWSPHAAALHPPRRGRPGRVRGGDACDDGRGCARPRGPAAAGCLLQVRQCQAGRRRAPAIGVLRTSIRVV